jgi:hypothetical protein
MPPQSSEFERDMQKLEAEIKRLEAEYNMFFAGRLPRLPWETRKQVEALVRRYDRLATKNTAERFRFGTLQARFASFCDLWEKQLKAKEEGRPFAGRGRRGGDMLPPAPIPPPPAETTRAGRDDLLHEARFRDPSREADRVKELYHRVAEARSQSGEAPIPFHRFAEVVRAQVAKLGGGESDVAFRVEVKEGKVMLKATKLKDE